jgi:hypothetical protein
MVPGLCHRHGFAALINGAGCIATMQPASTFYFACSLAVVWGCQQAGKYAIKGRLNRATQPWFVFRAHEVSYSGLISVQAFDCWDHGFAGVGCAAAFV